MSENLIFDKYFNINLDDCRELEIASAIYKNNQNEEEDKKAKAKQFKNQKQCLKCMKDKDETC